MSWLTHMFRLVLILLKSSGVVPGAFRFYIHFQKGIRKNPKRRTEPQNRWLPSWC